MPKDISTPCAGHLRPATPCLQRPRLAARGTSSANVSLCQNRQGECRRLPAVAVSSCDPQQKSLAGSSWSVAPSAAGESSILSGPKRQRCPPNRRVLAHRATDSSWWWPRSSRAESQYCFGRSRRKLALWRFRAPALPLPPALIALWCGQDSGEETEQLTAHGPCDRRISPGF